MSGTEGAPQKAETPEGVIEAYSRSIVLALAQTALISPLDSASRSDGGPHTWMAAYEIGEGDLDAVQTEVSSDTVVSIAMDFYREKLLGHWMVTGLDGHFDRAHHFANMAQLATAFEFGIEYFSGVRDEE